MIYALLIATGGIFLTAAKWAFFPFIPWRRLPRHRVRYLRLRLRLRLHPGAGHASVAELWLRWGRLAVLARSGRSRPSLSFWQRALGPAAEFSVLLGRAHYRHPLRLPLDEHVVVTSPPRGGKTGWLARVISRYPGPVLSTTTKHDVFALTSGLGPARAGSRVQPAGDRGRGLDVPVEPGGGLPGPGDRDPAGGRVRPVGQPARGGRRVVLG